MCVNGERGERSRRGKQVEYRNVLDGNKLLYWAGGRLEVAELKGGEYMDEGRTTQTGILLVSHFMVISAKLY